MRSDRTESGTTDPGTTEPGTTDPAGRTRPTRSFEIVNQRGLHARASAKFVRCAERFDARITVTKGGQSVGGTSIMGLMLLAATPGCCIQVDAEGPEATEALDALGTLVSQRFGESD